MICSSRAGYTAKSKTPKCAKKATWVQAERSTIHQERPHGRGSDCLDRGPVSQTQRRNLSQCTTVVTPPDSALTARERLQKSEHSATLSTAPAGARLRSHRVVRLGCVRTFPLSTDPLISSAGPRSYYTYASRHTASCTYQRATVGTFARGLAVPPCRAVPPLAVSGVTGAPTRASPRAHTCADGCAVQGARVTGPNGPTPCA